MKHFRIQPLAGRRQRLSAFSEGRDQKERRLPGFDSSSRLDDVLAITSDVVVKGDGSPYRGAMQNMPYPVGELLREWRRRRRLSQLDLAAEADISQRHLSFLESGRSQPSREMVLHLAESLAIPLRDRNVLLVAAGFAPVYSERSLEDPGLETARRVVELILRGHEPYPALAVDRHWTLLMANRPASHLLTGVAAELLEPPVNVLRLSLHPEGLAPRVVNLREWRAHILARLAQQVERSADQVLANLTDELKHYPVPADARPPRAGREFAGIAVPLELMTDSGVLSFLSTTTVFGTPVDISLAELAIESFFPADQATATAMHGLAS